MIDVRLFGKRIDQLVTKNGADKEKDPFAVRLPSSIDQAVLDELDDVEKEVIVSIANHSSQQWHHVVYNDFGDTDPDETFDAKKFTLPQAQRELCGVMYHAFKKYDHDSIRGLDVEGAPELEQTLGELEERTGCKTPYEYFCWSAQLIIGTLVEVGRLSIHELPRQTNNQEYDDGIIFTPFYVAIDARYIVAPNTHLITPYLASMMKTMRHILNDYTGVEEQCEGKTGSLVHGEYTKTSGANVYCLELLDVFSQNGVPLTGELHTLREEALDAIKNDFEKCVTDLLIDSWRDKTDRDRIFLTKSTGYCLAQLERYDEERFQRCKELITDQKKFSQFLESIAEESDDVEYLKRMFLGGEQ